MTGAATGAAAAARIARFLVPAGIDDPERVSGGNVYDRRVRDGLAELGWQLSMSETPDGDAVAQALAEVPDEATVMIDGLVAAWHPAAVEATAARARVVLLAHMVSSAFDDQDADRLEGERRSLGHASRVIATSGWTADELARRGLVDERRLIVAIPGSEPGPRARGAAGDLLCVGALAPHKGQDLLLDALDQLLDLEWSCTLAGSRDITPGFAEQIARRAAAFGSRVRLTGVLHGPALRDAYRRSGLLVAPSRTESFGMAIADAGHRGLPVIAAAVGGIPEAVSGAGALLVEPDDAGALAVALRGWITEPALRAELRTAAARARSRAPRWTDTVARIERVLVGA